MSAKRRQSGFTLVEIMVALLIGLFLTAGMVQMYVANRQTFRFSDAISRIQENGRYALEAIARDMRIGDFWGCSGSRGAALAVHLNAGAGACVTPDSTSTNAMAGTDGAAGAVGTPDLPDSITLRGSSGTGLIVAAGTTKTEIRVEGTVGNAKRVLGDPDDESGDIALISNCRGGDLFQVTAIGGGSPAVIAFDAGTDPDNPPGPPGNKTEILTDIYDNTAVVHAWREIVYSIQPGENGMNALFIQTSSCGGGIARELVEGVENMQITYGEDASGDGAADRYVPLPNVADMDRVVSVRVSLLLASTEDNLVDQAQQIDFDGQTFTAPDRRLHQVMTAAFAVRNRPVLIR